MIYVLIAKENGEFWKSSHKVKVNCIFLLKLFYTHQIMRHMGEDFCPDIIVDHDCVI